MAKYIDYYETNSPSHPHTETHGAYIEYLILRLPCFPFQNVGNNLVKSATVEIITHHTKRDAEWFKYCNLKMLCCMFLRSRSSPTDKLNNGFDNLLLSCFVNFFFLCRLDNSICIEKQEHLPSCIGKFVTA